MNRSDQISAFVNQKMAAYNIPGVSLGLLIEGEETLLQFGVASTLTQQPVVPETIFQVGSNTKTMTATLLMMLHEQGALSLDQPIQTVLPKFRVKNESVSQNATIRQLLTHSTGWIGDHFIETGAGSDASTVYTKSMHSLGQIAPPQTAFSYNNSAFALAGHIIEQVTGMPYAAALQTYLFEPLGMSNSLLNAENVMLRHFAVGHTASPEHRPTVAGPWPLPKAMFAAGAAACTAHDMLTYARFYLDGGTSVDEQQLLSTENMRVLWEPQFEIKEGWSMAHSWFVTDEGDTLSYSHGGATVGQISAFKIVPDKRFAFVSLTNSFDGRLFNADLETFLLREIGGLGLSTPTNRPASPAEIKELVGRYSRPMADLEIKLDDNDHLVLQATQKQGFPTENDPVRPPTPWMPISITDQGHLHVDNGSDIGAEAQIVRDDGEAIRYIRFGLRLHEKQA